MDIISIIIVCLLAMCSGLYVRDAQNDHLSAVPVGKNFFYTLSGSMFFVAVVLGVLVCSTQN